MGLGDVKMMLLAGAFLGLKRTVLTIFAGSVLGTVLGIRSSSRAAKARITNSRSAPFSASPRFWWYFSAPRS